MNNSSGVSGCGFSERSAFLRLGGAVRSVSLAGERILEVEGLSHRGADLTKSSLLVMSMSRDCGRVISKSSVLL